MQATIDNRDVPAATTRPMSHTRGFSRGRQVPDGIVGHARSVEEILDRIDRVSATNATVLITGETGTGKELVARAIHRRSRRSSHAMVSANLAALPHELVASELFGHEAGAFTGAVQRRIGRFEAAHASSLFLDEVGELPLGVQVALLRALEGGEFERVGSSQTRTEDVRVIAATNRNLEEAIEEGLFRRDLFYRLAVFPIHLPPLRERREDIADLADHFLAQVTDRIGRAFSGIDPDSMDRLMAYNWPGNIRELQNVIEHSAILSDGGLLQVPPMLLPTRIMAGPTTASTLSHAIEAGAATSAADMPEVILTDRECRARERANLMKALQRAGGRVYGAGGAAELLGINPTTLASRLRALKITPLKLADGTATASTRRIRPSHCRPPAPSAMKRGRTLEFGKSPRCMKVSWFVGHRANSSSS